MLEFHNEYEKSRKFMKLFNYKAGFTAISRLQADTNMIEASKSRVQFLTFGSIRPFRWNLLLPTIINRLVNHWNIFIIPSIVCLTNDLSLHIHVVHKNSNLFLKKMSIFNISLCIISLIKLPSSTFQPYVINKHLFK